MRIKILLLLLAPAFMQVRAQSNMILNGSLETYTACPYDYSLGWDEVEKAQGWYAVRPTADYFNTCATMTNVSVPQNHFGWQMPACGNAYAGMWSYISNTTSPNIREAIGTSITSPLTVGQKYFVKLKVSLAEGYYYSDVAINKFGLRFTTVKHNSVTTAPVNNFAHVYSTTPLTDTLNWTTIFSPFVADSAYKYIEIGNFFNDLNTTVQVLKPGAVQAYYYVDDVCLSTDSLFALTWNCTTADGIEEVGGINSSFGVFPNPCANGTLYLSKTIYGRRADIYNSSGTRVRTVAAGELSAVDVSGLPEGVYILRFEGPHTPGPVKFIIKKPAD